jgi:ornithine carbamoyltransferase
MYSFDQEKRSYLTDLAYSHRGSIVYTTDPQEAVKNTDFIYADTFVSMGEESIADIKTRHFDGYQVNTELMSLAKKNCYFMHCLPAHRGVEVTDAVMD